MSEGRQLKRGTRLFTRRYARPGSAPGWQGGMVEAPATATRIRTMLYSEHLIEEHDLPSLSEAFEMLDDQRVTWLDVVGLGDHRVLRDLADHLEIHPLVLEDLVNVGQRPKIEEHEGYVFVVMRLLHPAEDELVSEQISMLLGPTWVITVQEHEGDCFGAVRERIREGSGRIRKSRADYLAYALIDAIVDHYFPLLEDYSERIEQLEEEVSEDATKDTLHRIHATKKDLMILRRGAWPQREVVHALERLESPLVQKQTQVFLRDCYDHAIQILDIVENYRDLAGDLKDLYLSTASFRMNEIMQVLTIMATLFIPLTFIAGIYGMNFDPDAGPWNMPELRWPWGYPGVLALMAAMVGGMLAFFRKKGWF